MTLAADNSRVGDLSGAKLYAPGVILAYFVLGNMALGLFLYGRNIAGRGQRVMGGVLSAASALAVVLLMVAAAVGALSRPSVVWLPTLLNFFVGVGVFQLERGPYRRALARGAKRARWWPPLLVVLLISLLMEAAVSILASAGL